MNLNICSFQKPGILQAATTDKGVIERIEGMFALTETVSTPSSWGECWELADGVFKPALKEKGDQFILAQHDFEKVLGARDNGTAELKAVDQGLWGAAVVPLITWAQDFVKQVARGDIKSASFGFNVVSSEWRQEKKMDVMRITALELWEASVVTIPRFADTKGKIKAIVPAGLDQPLAASLFRALNRAAHDLEMDDDDRTILDEFKAKIDGRVPEDLKVKIASRGIAAAPQVFAPKNDPKVIKTWRGRLDR